MNPYKPNLVKIVGIKNEASDVRTFAFKFIDPKIQRRFKFKPGQFIEVSSFGIGESTFEVFKYGRSFGFSIKKVGGVTKSMFEKSVGDIIGIRGPYGNGWPLKDFRRKNMLLIGGGIGIPPIRALLQEILGKRRSYRDIDIFYGAKTPKEIVYKKEFKEWDKARNTSVHLTVDKGSKSWKGNVGVVTTLFEGMKFNRSHVAAICGPPIMIKFVVKTLMERGLKEKQIYTSMERLMQCGFGTCGHCNIGKLYVCKDGPIFRVDQLNELTERSW
jgi:NAD(P)H-flavin reductase